MLEKYPRPVMVRSIAGHMVAKNAVAVAELRDLLAKERGEAEAAAIMVDALAEWRRVSHETLDAELLAMMGAGPPVCPKCRAIYKMSIVDGSDTVPVHPASWDGVDVSACPGFGVPS